MHCANRLTRLVKENANSVFTESAVGISIANPDTGARLHVDGDLRISGGSNSSLYHYFGTTQFTTYTSVEIKDGGTQRFYFNKF